jgi:hypothetical protein
MRTLPVDNFNLKKFAHLVKYIHFAIQQFSPRGFVGRCVLGWSLDCAAVWREIVFVRTHGSHSCLRGWDLGLGFLNFAIKD